MNTNKDEGYCGYTNWDTWNAYLWLSNNEYIYKLARRCLNKHDLKDFWVDMLEGKDGIETRKINFRELYDALNEE